MIDLYMERVICDFCKGKKEIIISEEAQVYFICPKCDGVGSVYMLEDGHFAVIEEEVDIEANIKRDIEDREKLRMYAKRKYND